MIEIAEFLYGLGIDNPELVIAVVGFALFLTLSIALVLEWARRKTGKSSP